MGLGEALKMALGMIRTNKLRGFFTVLGTVVGVTFLIAVITMIEGMNTYMEKDFAGTIFGVNSVTLRRRPSIITEEPSPALRREWQRRPRISFDDAAWLKTRMETPGVLALSASNVGKVKGSGNKEVENVFVTGASASYFQIRDMKLERGRAFTENEGERGVPVVVIGKDVASNLFEGRNPIGQVVRIRGFPYTVIGVLEKQGSLFGTSLDNQAIAPIKSNLNGFVNNVPNKVDELTFKVPVDNLMAPAQEELESWMRIRHHLRPGQPNDFELETAEQSLSFWNKIKTIMLIALPGLVSISLVVGAVVIMNIMLVSVSARTREIGLRKSLGARRRDILTQFLVEAGTLSGAGGLIGIGLGLALAKLIAKISPIPAEVSWPSIGLAILLAVGVGLLAGVYPAYRASRLDPIVALRAE